MPSTWSQTKSKHVQNNLPERRQETVCLQSHLSREQTESMSETAAGEVSLHSSWSSQKYSRWCVWSSGNSAVFLAAVWCSFTKNLLHCFHFLSLQLCCDEWKIIVADEEQWEQKLRAVRQTLKHQQSVRINRLNSLMMISSVLTFSVLQLKTKLVFHFLYIYI